MPTASTRSDVQSLGARKLAQARSLLEEASLGAWLIVVRESADRPDPSLSLLLDLDFTWTSFFLVTPDASAALVAGFDAPDVERSGLFDEVRTYKEGPREALLQLLRTHDPPTLGINVSVDDALADGLTAGLRDYLEEVLDGTPFAGRLRSAAALVAALRGVKLPEEQERIRNAVDETEAIFDRVRAELRIGLSAREIAERFQRSAAAGGHRPAWPAHHCPTVTVGARAPVGHVGPGEERIEPGCVIHVDFGIVREGYRSDLQRTWYAAGPEGEVPEPVRRAYAAVVEAIDAGARALKPGVPGWRVDQAARESLKARGYPEYAHALGHHLGRAVHDGGGLLGPRWERYGSAPEAPVREGHVYTLEPSLYLAGHGMISLEEDVVVGPGGVEFLSRFPREIPLLKLT